MARLKIPRLTKWEPAEISNTNLYIIYTNIGYFVGDRINILGISEKRKAPAEYDPFRTKKEALACVASIGKPLEKEIRAIVKKRKRFYEIKKAPKKIIDDSFDKKTGESIIKYLYNLSKKKDGYSPSITEVREHLNKIGIPIKSGRLQDIILELDKKKEIKLIPFVRPISYADHPDDLLVKEDRFYHHIRL